MKKLLKRLALLLSFATAGTVAVSYHNAHDNRPMESNHASPAQAKSSHRLSFLDKEGTTVDYCTGTAIGPHAILTAQHCDANAGSLALKIDYSPRHYKILTGVVDGRDHLILLVDGPAFTNIDPLILRAPKQGEPVFIYGFGHGSYPAPRKEGVIISEYDPSEVNAGEEMFYSSIAVIAGESGSAVYGLDGALLGVLTYMLTDSGLGFSKTEEGGFQLHYDAETIANVQKFQPPTQEGDSDARADKRTPVQPQHTARATDGALPTRP